MTVSGSSDGPMRGDPCRSRKTAADDRIEMSVEPGPSRSSGAITKIVNNAAAHRFGYQRLHAGCGSISACDLTIDN
jgi:hypothetical protein